MECWGTGEGTGRQGPHVYMYVFVEESFMKRTEVSRTTDWEATCENMLRSWVMFERSGDSLKSWRTRLQADGTAFEMVLGTGRMEEGFRGCTGKSQGLQMGKSGQRCRNWNFIPGSLKTLLFLLYVYDCFAWGCTPHAHSTCMCLKARRSLGLDGCQPPCR